RYINSRATESLILRISHYMTFMGVVLGSAVIPTALCVSWNKANKWGCIVGAVGGFFAGIIAWLVATACLNEGIISVVVSLCLKTS
ncbi:hypothetical protein C0992_000422, partial [Termitomyces sp. T32_za158]